MSTIFALLGLQNMPRPFKKMKDLDMDEVIEDIVKKLNEWRVSWPGPYAHFGCIFCVVGWFGAQWRYPPRGCDGIWFGTCHWNVSVLIGAVIIIITRLTLCFKLWFVITDPPENNLVICSNWILSFILFSNAHENDLVPSVKNLVICSNWIFSLILFSNAHKNDLVFCLNWVSILF